MRAQVFEAILRIEAKKMSAKNGPSPLDPGPRSLPAIPLIE